MKRMLTVIVCLVCCLVAPVVQAGEKKPMSDPSGTWRWNFEINGNTIDNVLKVNTDKDGKLTGALEAHGLKMDVQEGKVTGDEVSFQIEAQLDQKITVRFLGKIEGDKINGNLTAKGDGEAREFPWTATRSVQAADVVGAWQLHIVTPDGETLQPVLTIAAKDKVLTATYALNDKTIEVSELKLKDNQVTCGGRGTGAAGNALSVDNGPTQDRGHGRRVPEEPRCQPRQPEQRTRRKRQAGRATRTTLHRLRCLQAGHGCSEAWRRCDPDNSARISLGPLYLCDRKRPERIHGEARHCRRPNHEAHAGSERQGDRKESEGRVGLMCRHCEARRELFDRIQNGEIGDITMMRAYRMAGPTGTAATGPKPEGVSELLYQISRFHGFLWLSGGAVSDFLIHNIDESCWMKNAWPVSCKANGGRHYRGDNVDQNFDNYSMEYTFDDGTKLFVNGVRFLAAIRNSPATLTAPRGWELSRPHHTGRHVLESTKGTTKTRRIWPGSFLSQKRTIRTLTNGSI
jgi:hypothetical protein